MIIIISILQVTSNKTKHLEAKNKTTDLINNVSQISGRGHNFF